MQFSLGKMLLVFLFINFVAAATFAFPAVVAFPLLTFVSLVVLPPFLVIGVVHSRGIRQSFFLGAMVSGTAHYFISFYLAYAYLISLFDGSGVDGFIEDEFTLHMIHPVGYLIGAFGGTMGMIAYWFQTSPKRQSKQVDSATRSFDADEAGSGKPIAPAVPQETRVKDKTTVLPR